MQSFAKSFSVISKKDVIIAGGKGASLGEMTKAKMNVPPGFVVLAGTFDKFIKETDLVRKIAEALKKLDHKNIKAVERASKKIRGLIKGAKFPKDIADEIIEEFKKLKAPLVAVRSSATTEDSLDNSWAGLLESYLNVEKNDLLESVKKCWASLFSPRAIFYRSEKKLNNQGVSVAVVVQKMVQSEISGICFTVHPVTNNRDRMVVEAGYGLGEAIVGGKITPDTYIVSKKSFQILDKNIAEQKMMIVWDPKGTKEMIVPRAKQAKQKMSDEQILKLARICRTIEKHYKKPQDIEWAIDKGKFYITQSRPITTLK